MLLSETTNLHAIRGGILIDLNSYHTLECNAQCTPGNPLLSDLISIQPHTSRQERRNSPEKSVNFIFRVKVQTHE